MSTETRIRELVEAKLTGRTCNVVGCVEELFRIAMQVVEIRCTPVENRGLRFQFGGQLPFEVPLDAARGKLRSMCARLGVISREQTGLDLCLYGHEAEFAYGLLGCWHLRFWNTMGRQEFILSALEVPAPSHLLHAAFNTRPRYDPFSLVKE